MRRIMKGERNLMRKKGIIAAGLTLVMSLGLCTTCFAAGVSASEQKILDALKKLELSNGASIELPAKYYAQVDKYLTTYELTDAAVDDVLTKIGEVKTILVEEDVKSIADAKTVMSSSTEKADKIVAAANNVAKAAGVADLNISYADGKIDYALADKKGDEIKPNDSVIKDTGINATATAAVAAAGIVVLGGCVAVARKNDLFAEEA